MSVESIIAELKDEISTLSGIYADRGMYDTKAEEIVYLDPAEDDGESYCDNAICRQSWTCSVSLSSYRH